MSDSTIRNPSGTNDCTCCTSSRASEIDAALRIGTSLRAVAARFGISKSAVAHHKKEHLQEESAAPALVAQALERAHSAPPVQGSGDVLSELTTLKTTITAFLQVALTTGKLNLPLVRELRATQELLLKSMLVIEQRPSTPAPPVHDLSRLSEEELETLHYLIGKLEATEAEVLQIAGQAGQN